MPMILIIRTVIDSNIVYVLEYRMIYVVTLINFILRNLL